MVERDSALLDEAHGLFAKGPRLVATALTAEELGRVHRERGNRQAAVSALRRALTVWFSLGAMSDVRRTARRLSELGVRTRAGTRRRGGAGWESLTPTEATVAVLVGEGMTNAEIAARLVVSRRTVETHVAHVLAKLDVRSRAGIARMATERTR
jgi:DNA-binding CsgD family transcriptional regulator